eukprot:8745460-Pyramimonas_sp.AAC.1
MELKSTDTNTRTHAHGADAPTEIPTWTERMTAEKQSIAILPLRWSPSNNQSRRPQVAGACVAL